MRTLKFFVALLIAVFVVTSCNPYEGINRGVKKPKKDQNKETVKKDDTKKDKEKKDVAKKDEKKDDAGKEKKDVKIVPSKNDVVMDVGSGSSVGSPSGGSKNKVSTNIVLDSKDIPGSTAEEFVILEEFAQKFVSKYDGRYLVSRLAVSDEKDKKVGIQTFFILSGSFLEIIEKVNKMNEELTDRFPPRQITETVRFAGTFPLNNNTISFLPDTLTFVSSESEYYCTTKKMGKFKSNEWQKNTQNNDDPYEYSSFSEIWTKNIETAKWVVFRKLINVTKQELYLNVTLPLEVENSNFIIKDNNLDTLLLKNYFDRGIFRIRPDSRENVSYNRTKGELTIGRFVYGGMDVSPVSIVLLFTINTDKKINKKKK